MSDNDDYSDLTDMDSDEGSEFAEKQKKLPKKKGKGKASAGSSGYRIKNALKVPRATTYTAQALYDQIHSQDINLEPEYQRDVVWPESKQIGIIDSVFRNFYIPPVIFVVNSFEDGSETRTCIDGKQRLTSIHRFMSGLIPHKDPHTGEKLWYKDAGSAIVKTTKARRLLPDKYRRLFANKQIVCVEYQDITDADEREIFQRVQLGMALTPAEKLQVLNGPYASFIRELQNTYLKDDSLLGGDALAWDQARGADFRGLAEAIYLMANPHLKGTSIPQLEKFLSNPESPSATFRKSVEDTYKILSSLVRNKKLQKPFKKPAKISPVEFIMIGVFIYTWKDELTMAQVSAGVGKMREDVRKQHVDIRMNSRVIKGMIEFVKAYDAAEIPGDTDVVARDALGSVVGEKRKRGDRNDQDDDEDDEDDELEDEEADAQHQPVEPPPKRIHLSARAPLPFSAGTPQMMPLSPNKDVDRTAKSQATKKPSSSSARTPVKVPPPTPQVDRMAALRAAQNSMAKPKFGAPSSSTLGGGIPPPGISHLPSPPANSNSSISIGSTPNSSAFGVGGANSIPSPPASAGGAVPLDANLMATMMRGSRPNGASGSGPGPMKL